MKKILFALTLLSALNSFAAEPKTIEFDEAEEKSCAQMVEKLGCSVDDGGCIEVKKASLSSTCQNIHSEKKKNKSY